MDFDRLLRSWQITFYSQIFMFVVELTALLLGILYARKDKAVRWFIFYIAFDFCILLTHWYMDIDITISKAFKSIYLNITNSLIASVELLAYFYFFSLVLKGKNIKLVLKILSLLFLLIIILYLTTRFSFITHRFSYITYLIGALEFLLLLPLCLLYFYQLINKINSSRPLLQIPSFWIVTGIFFFSIISIPYYLVNLSLLNSSTKTRYIFATALYYLPFSINFVFLSKAFLCKKTLTI